jgi:hypothetical protein
MLTEKEIYTALVHVWHEENSRMIYDDREFNARNPARSGINGKYCWGRTVNVDDEGVTLTQFARQIQEVCGHWPYREINISYCVEHMGIRVLVFGGVATRRFANSVPTFPPSSP